jgi:ribosomal protein L11 methyltransferase
MKEGGLLILSGFYTSDVALLQEKAEALGLHASATLSDHDWACLVLS